MMLQVVASPTIVILMTLEVSFMLLENIYSTASLMFVTYGCQNVFIVQATGLELALVHSYVTPM